MSEREITRECGEEWTMRCSAATMTTSLGTRLCARRAGSAACASHGYGACGDVAQGFTMTVAVVVGFPQREPLWVKALEARLAIEDGADELDMVMNIGKFLSGRRHYVRRDIMAVIGREPTAGCWSK